MTYSDADDAGGGEYTSNEGDSTDEAESASQQ